MKAVKIILFNMFIMIILDIYLVFFSHIENLPETHYSSIYAFFNIDNVILIILFSLAIINGVLLLINIYNNKE